MQQVQQPFPSSQQETLTQAKEQALNHHLYLNPILLSIKESKELESLTFQNKALPLHFSIL